MRYNPDTERGITFEEIAKQCDPWQDNSPLPSIAHLPLSIRDSFKILDDLQEICHDGCVLDDAKIGAIQAKLIIIRINLNVHFGVSTEQRGRPGQSPRVAASLG